MLKRQCIENCAKYEFKRESNEQTEWKLNTKFVMHRRENSNVLADLLQHFVQFYSSALSLHELQTESNRNLVHQFVTNRVHAV